MNKQAKFTYSLLGKPSEKQVKTIEYQGEKQIKITEDHEKQQAKSNALIIQRIVKKILQKFWNKKRYFIDLLPKGVMK